MIALEDVSVSFPVKDGRIDVLSDVSVEFEPGSSVGIVGLKGCGKTTFMRLLGAQIRPTVGTIKRSGTVSWPMTSLRPLAKSLTVRANIKFLASVYGVPVAPLTRRVTDLSGLHGYLDVRMERLPHNILLQAAYSMCLAMEFDYYLADESILLGDGEFRQKAQAHLDAMRGQRSLIMASRNARLVQKYCDITYVLHEGKLKRYDDPAQAAAALKAL